MAGVVHTFGVRHHGPGSARSVLRALESLTPDCVLVEGPPDAAEVLASATHAGMKPPVALLVWQTDTPSNATFYPFVEFSPEWVAVRWALARAVPVRFIDLPQYHRMAIKAEKEGAKPGPGDPPELQEAPALKARDEAERLADPDFALALQRRLDPLSELARVAGFTDGERWWEHLVEHRQGDDAGLFDAVCEAIAALREHELNQAESAEADDAGVLLAELSDSHDPRREAWMRKSVREAQKAFERVAVVCGAWHAPALSPDVLAAMKKADDALLKGLPKVKTSATWVPWTFDRLSSMSGYRAGVQSPVWYEHLWQHETHKVERWMTRVARMLRSAELDCSSAHAIEATRLATTLAQLRGRHLADLVDIQDATRAIFCFDSDMAMQLIGRKLLVGDRLGQVPEETPTVPLQQDLTREQKRLRLKPEALRKPLDLDLRKENDLARSHLLHRLRLMQIGWGTPQEHTGGKGTFHELWLLRWDPGFVVRLIELGRWGNTIGEAAAALAEDAARRAGDLPTLTQLLEHVLLADLPDAVSSVMTRVRNAAAVASDVLGLVAAVPPLANILRYGNVRQTDVSMVAEALGGIVPRVFVQLGGAVSNIDHEAANGLLAHVLNFNSAIDLIARDDYRRDWHACLANICTHASSHGLIRGRACRILLDDRQITADAVATQLSLALSVGADPADSAAWIEGFLSGSGLLLVHDDKLLAILDEWVSRIATEQVTELVPLLRRTFSTFAAPERRAIGGKITAGRPGVAAAPEKADDNVNPERAARVLPTLQAIFGTTTR